MTTRTMATGDDDNNVDGDGVTGNDNDANVDGNDGDDGDRDSTMGSSVMGYDDDNDGNWQCRQRRQWR